MPYLPEHIGYQGTDTSYLSALHQVGKVHFNRAKVFMVIKDHGPMTCAAICAHLGLKARSVNPRLCELRDLGLIYDTGERGYSDMGMPSIMWAVKTEETFTGPPDDDW